MSTAIWNYPRLPEFRAGKSETSGLKNRQGIGGAEVSQTQERAARPASSQQHAIELAVVREPDSAVAEAYRSLRSTVKFAGVVPPVRSVLIADAGTNGQHVSAAANLAAALALAGDSTILIDADMRRPQLHRAFGVPESPGLADALRADIDLDSILSPTSVANLRMLPAGRAGGSAGPAVAWPSDLLNGDACRRLLDELTSQAEFLVVNAPPLTEAGDALALAAQVDGVLLLVRSGKTKRVHAQQAKESLQRVGARLLGAVLTDTRKGTLFGG